MAHTTLCPHCQTAFRVANDQLKLRAGLVRCGACQKVFNGLEHLVPEADPPAIVPEPTIPSPVAAPASPPQLFQNRPDAGSTLLVRGAMPAARSGVLDEIFEEDAWATAAPMKPAPSEPAVLVPEPVVIEPVAVEPAAVEPAAVEPVAVEPEVVEPVVVEPVVVEPVVVEPVVVEPEVVEPVVVEPVVVEPVVVEPVVVEPIVVEPVVVEPVVVEPEVVEAAVVEAAVVEPITVDPAVAERAVAGPAVAAGPLIAQPVVTELADLARAAPATPEAPPLKTIQPVEIAEESEEPGFVIRARRAQRHGRPIRAGMMIGSALLLLTLLLQGAIVFRHQLSASVPGSAPLLRGLCSAFGCQPGLPTQIDAVSIESSELQQSPAQKDSLTVAILLRNRSAIAQAWPNIELSLNDANDKTIVRRVFSAGDYLTPTKDTAAGFAATSEQAVRLLLDVGQLQAAGYRVTLYYP